MALTEAQQRAGAIAYVNKVCGQDFVGNALPPDIEVVVDMLTKSMKENPAVASQSLGDMSKSFFRSGTHDAAMVYLRPYRKHGFK